MLRMRSAFIKKVYNNFMFDPRNLYRDEILEHFRDPQNFGKLSSYDKKSRQHNPLCGDEIELFVKFDENRIYDVGFVGKGCAISISATSILTEYVKEKHKTKLQDFSDEHMIALMGVEVSHGRRKCALLGLSVLRDCLEE